MTDSLNKNYQLLSCHAVWRIGTPLPLCIHRYYYYQLLEGSLHGLRRLIFSGFKWVFTEQNKSNIIWFDDFEQDCEQFLNKTDHCRFAIRTRARNNRQILSWMASIATYHGTGHLSGGNDGVRRSGRCVSSTCT